MRALLDASSLEEAGGHLSRRAAWALSPTPIPDTRAGMIRIARWASVMVPPQKNELAFRLVDTLVMEGEETTRISSIINDLELAEGIERPLWILPLSLRERVWCNGEGSG
ncbi:MAG: hypothetical protein JMM76_00170 [Candidatus Xiphinematobacter sp.]|nr:MAG: hypothetical protein JMM79_00170 [Candidatus Xiphinematobacter sp.]QQY09140.1 MAG: hypothetical protein JMM76_00170 [Candidatus Xiphinematobacter sp.]QQY11365.1 MAG: hypothetical protein JMM77_00175 [Candidatus Xiphinematobacter sp.]